MVQAAWDCFPEGKDKAGWCLPVVSLLLTMWSSLLLLARVIRSVGRGDGGETNQTRSVVKRQPEIKAMKSFMEK